MSQKKEGATHAFRLEYSVIFLIILFVLAFFMLQYNKASKLVPITANTHYPIYINLMGDVKSPGIIELDNGATLKEAVAACGGVLNESIPFDENRTLQNGESIVVAFPKEGDAQRININTATLEELKTLPNIGDKTAGFILEYRTENNSFRTFHDLLLVSGIGEKTLAKLMPYITLE